MSTPAHQRGTRGPDDAELVRAVLHGDKEAFSELVRRNQASLFRYASSMGMAPDVAQDLVQDAFVRAFLRLQQCKDGAAFRSWVLSIFRHMMLDHARNVRRSEIPLAAIEHSVSTRDAQPELKGAIDRALRALPELLREAFLLRHHHGYTYDEIAEITDSKTSAVKMRVQRAREQLRAALDDEFVRG